MGVFVYIKAVYALKKQNPFLTMLTIPQLFFVCHKIGWFKRKLGLLFHTKELVPVNSPETDQVEKKYSIMVALKREFEKHREYSRILPTLWHTMMLMAVSKEEYWKYLCDLFWVVGSHDDFMYTFMLFQAHESKERKGAFWLGGLKSEVPSLTNEMLNREHITGSPDWMKDIYQRFEARLDGKFESIYL